MGGGGGGDGSGRDTGAALCAASPAAAACGSPGKAAFPRAMHCRALNPRAAASALHGRGGGAEPCTAGRREGPRSSRPPQGSVEQSGRAFSAMHGEAEAERGARPLRSLSGPVLVPSLVRPSLPRHPGRVLGTSRRPFTRVTYPCPWGGTVSESFLHPRCPGGDGADGSGGGGRGCGSVLAAPAGAPAAEVQRSAGRSVGLTRCRRTVAIFLTVLLLFQGFGA